MVLRRPNNRETWRFFAGYPARGLDKPPGALNEFNEEPDLSISSYIKEIEMPRGRPTADHKNNPIRVRLNDEMREWIEKKSEITGRTISQIIRDMIEHEMKTK